MGDDEFEQDPLDPDTVDEDLPSACAEDCNDLDSMAQICGVGGNTGATGILKVNPAAVCDSGCSLCYKKCKYHMESDHDQGMAVAKAIQRAQQLQHGCGE